MLDYLRSRGINRTTVAAFLTFLAGLLGYLGESEFLAAYSEQLMMAAGIAFGVLRFWTTLPMFATAKKQK